MTGASPRTPALPRRPRPSRPATTRGITPNLGAAQGASLAPLGRCATPCPTPRTTVRSPTARPRRPTPATSTNPSQSQTCTVPELFAHGVNWLFVTVAQDRVHGCSPAVPERGSDVRLVAAGDARRVRDGRRIVGAAPRGRRA